MAASEWIISLDADDKYAADVLEKMVERQAQTNADIVTLKLVFADAHMNRTGKTIPSADFDMTQCLTGREAVMLTVRKWRINTGGMLISKAILDKRSPIKNYMNADEFDSRQSLIFADKVAFSDAEYIYRGNDNSITRKFSPKLFDTLLTSMMTADLLGRTFGIDSTEHNLGKRCLLEDCLSKRLLLLRNSNQLVEDKRSEISVLIETAYRSTPRNGIRFRSIRKSLLISNNYESFIRKTATYHKIECYFSKK